ncbi:hypothetical protein C2G38_2140536 [Gigaspora rosea]|uniref:Uncharacterized protein n=1 Tax=Gigaspora rosea TaxID=44941 RepID=A0A397VGX3_9GLOM|nr:hypothetical protein C2G38_2140536 [Gigaspora rosea]
MNLVIPKERSAHNINEAKKSVVGLCYMMAGLRNKFVNQYKLEVGLYLMASGATWDAVDTMSKLGYSVCANTVKSFRKKVQRQYVIKLEEHFTNHKNRLHVYNIDDYHAIHGIRRPDTTSISSANHFATCIAKPVLESQSILLVHNNVSIHNPANIEAPRICWYLIHNYSGIFDIPYFERQLLWVSQNRVTNELDRIDALMYTIPFLRNYFTLFLVPVKHAKKPRPWWINLILELTRNGWIKIRDKIIKKFGKTLNHNSAFKDNYHKTRRYPYTLPALDLLDKKTSLFLLEYFQDLFYNRGKSGPKLKKKRQKLKVYHLATLKENVDLRHLPTAYSSSYLPQPNLCDYCKHPFSEEDGMVLICGHGYHLTCYNRKCTYCEKFYKKEIFKNVKKFLERLEGEDKLTLEDFDDDEDTEKEGWKRLQRK